MNDLDLTRRLKILRRSVLMLETELRNDHMDNDLLADIDRQMEEGLAAEPRTAFLRERVDALRENVMGSGSHRFRDAIRSTAELRDAIEEVMALLG